MRVWVLLAAVSFAGCTLDWNGIAVTLDSGRDAGSVRDASVRRDVPVVVPEDAHTPLALCGDREQLRLCLRCEEEVRDESEGALAITSNVNFAPGAVGLGCAFDSQTSLTVPADPSFDALPITFEAFVRLEELPGPDARMAVADRDSSWGFFVYGGGELRCLTAADSVVATRRLSRDRWTHVACVIEAERLNVFVDGVLSGSSPILNGVGLSTDALRIGENGPSGDRWLGGIDEVRFFSEARTEDQIATAAARRPR